MRFTVSFYTFLIFNLRLCCSNMASFQHAQSQKNQRNCTNCRNVQREIESIKQMEIIKLEIMRRLNISAEKQGEIEKEKQTTPKPEPEVVTGSEHRGADILSYSEPADNFTDENIVQFRLGNKSVAGSRLLVKSANLLVRVKYKRRKKIPSNSFRSKRNILKGTGKKKKKNSKTKAVDLKLYTVNKNGEPGSVITSVTSKLKKTKWLKLSLPRNIVQNAIDTNNLTFQVYITCKGCGKRANVILVHKSRKRKRKRNRQVNRKRKLHKRRPMLITRVTKMDRNAPETAVTGQQMRTQQNSEEQH